MHHIPQSEVSFRERQSHLECILIASLHRMPPTLAPIPLRRASCSVRSTSTTQTYRWIVRMRCYSTKIPSVADGPQTRTALRPSIALHLSRTLSTTATISSTIYEGSCLLMTVRSGSLGCGKACSLTPQTTGYKHEVAVTPTGVLYLFLLQRSKVQYPENTTPYLSCNLSSAHVILIYDTLRGQNVPVRTTFEHIRSKLNSG